MITNCNLATLTSLYGEYGKSLPLKKKHTNKKLQPALEMTFSLFEYDLTGPIRKQFSLTYKYELRIYRTYLR